MASLKTSTTRGFTLIEISVALGILLMLFSFGLIMSMDAFRGSIFRSEREIIVSLLERARSHSMANIDGSAWGVCYRANKYVLFKGTTCGAPAPSDEEFEVNQSVATDSNFASTFPTISFAQLSGQSSAATITVVEANRSSSITINHEGTINW
jgi:prepilin-type N-terminal cleavage/methylation domain-containing protein